MEQTKSAQLRPRFIVACTTVLAGALILFAGVAPSNAQAGYAGPGPNNNAPGFALATSLSITGWADNNGDSIPDPGDTVSFNVVGTNLGADVVNMWTANAATGASAPMNPAYLMHAGNTASYSFSYTLTAADTAGMDGVHGGAFVSHAFVEANCGGCNASTVVDSPDATSNSLQIYPTPVLGISVTQSIVGWNDANADAVQDAGDTLSVKTVVTNTSAAPNNIGELSSVHVSSPLTSPSWASALTVGQQLTDTSSYTITAADVSRGSVGGTIMVSSVDAFKAVAVTASGSVNQTLTKAAITKGNAISDLGDDNKTFTYGDPGDVQSYSFSVTNTGNTVLSPVTASGCGSTSWDPSGPNMIPVGGSFTFTLDHTITAADATAGSLPACTVTVTAHSAAGGTVSTSASFAAVATTPLGKGPLYLATPAVVYVDRNKDGIAGDGGDLAQLTFKVANNGFYAASQLALFSGCLENVQYPTRTVSAGNQIVVTADCPIDFGPAPRSDTRAVTATSATPAGTVMTSSGTITLAVKAGPISPLWIDRHSIWAAVLGWGS